MQYNHIFSLKKAGRFHRWSWVLKTGIFLAVGFYMAWILENKKDLNKEFLRKTIEIYESFGGLLAVPVLLFFVNWSIEAIKWKYLSKKIEAISFGRAFRGILTGVALGFATPFGIGDYAGRVLQLSGPDRGRAVGTVLVSRLSQLLITLLLGGSSLVLFYPDFRGMPVSELSTLLGGLAGAGFLLLFFFRKPILSLIRRRREAARIYPYIEVISAYSRGELLYIHLLSLLRYLVFSFQFVLMLYFFGISTNLLLLFLGVNLVFLVKSFVPAFFDLGVRESAAVYFFSFLCACPENILFASLSIWVINVVIPSVLGLLLVFRLKIFAVR